MRSVILGHRGMVGSALHRLIPEAGIIPNFPNGKAGGLAPDLRHDSCSDWFLNADVLYLCAARVGGIQKNINEPGTMIYDNLMIQTNVIEAARRSGVKLFVFLGSSCIYPALPFGDADGNYLREGPLREDDLMKGKLEPTNEPYAIAKIAGIKMLEAYSRQYGMEYLAVMPCNLYGPGDNFDPLTSHFLPGMIRRFHEAKVAGAESVTLWGTGTPRRELMHVDDCASAIVNLVRSGARGLVNVGTGYDWHLSDYAARVADAVGFDGRIEWDAAKPDGVMRKLMDVSRMRGILGGSPDADEYAASMERYRNLRRGIESTYQWFLENKTVKPSPC